MYQLIKWTPNNKWWRNLPTPVIKITMAYKMKEAVRSISTSIDTSFVEEMVVENPTSSSVTHKDVEAIQALESTDTLQTSVKSNNDSEISGTRVFPDVPFDSESSKENQSKSLFSPNI